MQAYTLETNQTIVSPSGQRYPVGKLLGRGSFGAVHEAGPGKIMKIVRTRDSSTEKNFLTELAIQKTLSEKEPGVCPKLYEFGHIASSAQYIVIMEKCEGTARDLLKAQPFNPDVVLDYYEQVATILQKLEKYEFNHRDLKSDNVMYTIDPTTQKRTFLLIDFGFACITVDGKRLKGTLYFPPNEKCFRRSRDLSAMIFESLYLLKGDILTFAQLVLTFTHAGKTCDMTVGCKPLFYPAQWSNTYDFLNRPGVENPNTTPEGLIKAVEAYRQGGITACRAGFIVNPITDACVPVPAPPAASALKPGVSPKPHVANPAVVTPAKKPTFSEWARNRKRCPPGKVYNPTTRRCVKKKEPAKAKSCPPGKELNPKTKRCVKKKEAKKSCPPGKVLNPKTGRCIKEKKP